jgi:hypothetical protein
MTILLKPLLLFPIIHLYAKSVSLWIRLGFAFGRHPAGDAEVAGKAFG